MTCHARRVGMRYVQQSKSMQVVNWVNWMKNRHKWLEKTFESPSVRLVTHLVALLTGQAKGTL